MSKQVKQLDRVIIRFAGDSGDGMQLTGDRFTQESAVVRQRPGDAAELPRRDPGASGHAAGRLVVPGALRRPRHPDRGRRPGRAGGDEPGGAEGQPRRPAQGRGDHRRHPRLHRAQPRPRPGYDANPLDLLGDANDPLGEFAVHPVDLTGMTVEAVKEFGLSRKDAARAKNMFALGLLSWMYGRPTETTIAFLEKRFAKVADIRDANITAFKAGWNFGETTETFVVQYEIKPAPMPTGHLPQHHRQPGAVLRPGRRRACSPGCRSSSAPTRSPRPPTSSTSCQQAQGVRRHDAPGRGRDRRHRRGDRRLLRRLARRDHHLGPRHRAEVRGDRPGRDDRAAAARHRRAARRPLDRPADQDRAGRPAAGDVRPQRRGPGADRRAAVARRLLRRRHRGGPDRGHLPHPGDAALRRLPRQRLRAVADPRGRRPAGHRPGLRHRAQPRRSWPRTATETEEFWPYLRDEETLARPWAIPGTAGLEHRIGGLEKGEGHGNISYDPANHDLMVRTRQAKVDRIADSLPPLEVDDPSGAGQGAGDRLGLDVRPDRRRLPPGPQGRLPRRPGAPAPPQPVPQGPRRDPQALRQGARAPR